MQCSVAASYEHCRALARATAGNFYYSFLTLPADQRQAMCALYSFMRVTDDLGDSDAAPEVRSVQLRDWRDNLLRACEGTPVEHPVLPAVNDIIRRYQLPVQYLLDVIAGVEMDLVPAAYQTFTDLNRYCYHVAGAVGLACIHLWGFHDPRAIDAAVDCGTALQLTNILRDIQEDATTGRIYLPAEDLNRFHIESHELTASKQQDFHTDPRFQQLMQFEVSRAREYYARARPLFEYLEPQGRPILEAMLRIYGGILDEIERRRYDIFKGRVSLSRPKKLWIAGEVLVRHKLRGWFTRNP
ncbi:MAG: phytoene/squalene synthase family protein [Planctomycetes bacterium]|nr:phytoene/squalene synthase family protein [Planctomycetota bacterium]